MAELYTRSDWYYVRYVKPDKTRGKIPLRIRAESRNKKRDAIVATTAIEDLVSARDLGHSLNEKTRVWLDDVRQGNVKLHERLVKHGMVAGPKGAGKVATVPLTLKTHLADYFGRRKDAKPGTRINWGHTRRNLEAFFGGDKPLADVTIGDAKDFVRYLKTEARENAYADAAAEDGLSQATVHKRLTNAKQFFQDAVDRGLIDANPFARIKSLAGTNRDRDFFITREMTDKILEECPDDEWRLLFALSRFGGLRCPSEHLALRLDAVDWEKNRMRVDSPKTEHHDGGAFRIVPLFPELRPHVERVFNNAQDGATHFITRYRYPRQNLRTQLTRIIARAGYEAWPKLWHNLRATRQTELEEIFPSHVVCAWIGNSKEVARRHYLQVTDHHFDAAINLGPDLGPRIRRKGAQQEPQGAKPRRKAQRGVGQWAMTDSNRLIKRGKKQHPPIGAPDALPSSPPSTPICGSSSSGGASYRNPSRPASWRWSAQAESAWIAPIIPKKRCSRAVFACGLPGNGHDGRHTKKGGLLARFKR